MKVIKKNTKSSSQADIDVVELVGSYIKRFVYLTDEQAEAIAVWVCAAWLINSWVKFPHLCITSPEKRCGKTTLLTLLSHVTPEAKFASSMSPSAMYRLIKLMQPTILLDESQSLSNTRSDSATVMKELLNSGVEKNSPVFKSDPSDMDGVIEYNLYSPKVLALIGEPDTILADRCVIIEMTRKEEELELEIYRDIHTAEEGKAIEKTLSVWAAKVKKKVVATYSTMMPQRIGNERLANLLMPLRTVLAVIGRSDKLLTSYTQQVTDRNVKREYQSAGVLLLMACREIFGKAKFVGTADLIQQLCGRDEEPWHRFNRGKPINSETLATLLRKYKISPTKKQVRIGPKVVGFRGYDREAFEKPWRIYATKPKSDLRSS